MPYSKDNHISATAIRTSFVTRNEIKQATIRRFTFFWNMKSYDLAVLPDVAKKRAASVLRNVLLFGKEHFRVPLYLLSRPIFILHNISFVLLRDLEMNCSPQQTCVIEGISGARWRANSLSEFNFFFHSGYALYLIACYSSGFLVNLLAPELFFFILAHPVYKM